jgi:hypothetical protein
MGKGVTILEYLDSVTYKQAGDIEWQWANRFGYVRGIHYRDAMKRRMDGGKKSEGGVIGGAVNVVSGHIRRLGNRYGKIIGRMNAESGVLRRRNKIMNKVVRKCSCGKVGKGPGMIRWHGKCGKLTIIG